MENEDDSEIEEKEEVEEEIKDEKDLVEHAVEAIEHAEPTKHLSSETAKELDESKEVENIKKVEAALFISGRFLTLQELVMLTDINPLMIKEILEKLIEKYNDNSGIEIIEKGGGWKMDVCKEHVNMINKLATGNSEFTKAEQETLAVIAYKQPVKQSVIIKIRGNKAYEHIKKFIENGLVIGKRVGHTKELKLSDDFHEYFHIRAKDSKEIEDNENKTDEGTNEEPVISKEQSEEKNSLSDKQEDTNKDENSVKNSGEEVETAEEIKEENKQE